MRINSWPDFIFSKQIQHFKLSAKIDEQKIEQKISITAKQDENQSLQNNENQNDTILYSNLSCLDTNKSSLSQKALDGDQLKTQFSDTSAQTGPWLTEGNSSKQELLEALRLKLDSINGISFKSFANLVFADGNIDSRLMLVGEAPGEEEDKEGKPFVGKSGKLLTRFLELIVDDNGPYDRTRYYITNILSWRPPGNRTPTLEEIEIMKPYVIEHINIIDPLLIVPVGAIALKALSLQGITSSQGKLHKVMLGGIERNIFPVYHPSYTLRMPSKKRDLWISLLKMREIYMSLEESCLHK